MWKSGSGEVRCKIQSNSSPFNRAICHSAHNPALLVFGNVIRAPLLDSHARDQHLLRSQFDAAMASRYTYIYQACSGREEFCVV